MIDFGYVNLLCKHLNYDYAIQVGEYWININNYGLS